MVLDFACLKVASQLACRIRARQARQPAAGMCAGATQVQPLQRCPVLRPPNQRAKREELIESLLPVMYVPTTQPILFFQVARRDYLSFHD
jgi:hypothetical protein